MDAAPFYAEGTWWRVYPAGGYYNANSLRWLDYGGFGGGMSIFEKKWVSADWPKVLTLRTEQAPNRLRLTW